MYSADGTQVTLYLDGVGVPVTQSQRALTTEMAKMSHDFYEVVFWNNNPLVVARATWEIGQSAGIKGVYKGLNEAGCMYFYNAYPESLPFLDGLYGIANLFVGRKVDKTLLAIGSMPVTNISSSTKSVTFTVDAITTNLSLDSFTFVTAAGDKDGTPPYSNVNGNTIAEEVSLGGEKYPYYKLPNYHSVAAEYRFNFGGSFLKLQVMELPGDSIKEVIKREPRFLAGGQYYYVQAAKIDTGTKVEFADTYVDGTPATFSIKFIFDTSESQGGIFSFTFRIPVFNMTRISSGDGVPFTTWYMQPGFGRDLFSLDNGKDAGGCILMGYNAEVGDMMDIFTAGMPW